jgi:inorganic pyrophosphatase
MIGVSSLAQKGRTAIQLTHAVQDGATYPGVILPCRPLGMVELVQEGAKGPIENPRLILMPIWHDRMGELEKAADRPALVKAEIEQFFLSATLFTDKRAKVTGWRGPKAAHKLVNASLTGRNT